MSMLFAYGVLLWPVGAGKSGSLLELVVTGVLLPDPEDWVLLPLPEPVVVVVPVPVSPLLAVLVLDCKVMEGAPPGGGPNSDRASFTYCA